jgi:hypothetical protein
MEVEQLERSSTVSSAAGRVFYRPASRNRLNSMEGVVISGSEPQQQQQQQQQQRIRLASSVLSVATIIKTEPRSSVDSPNSSIQQQQQQHNSSSCSSPSPSSASSIRRSRSRISTG